MFTKIQGKDGIMKNKILIVALFSILISSGCSSSFAPNPNNAYNTESNSSIKSNLSISKTSSNDNNLANLQNKGLKVIEDQSFSTELENWGKVRFITGVTLINKLPKLSFYLLDSKDNVLYRFPEFYGNMWILYEVKAVSFKDVNQDDMKDIIVIADYVLGHGDKAAVPFPVSGIYFQKDKDFVSVPELDKEINEKKQNVNIDMILKYAGGKNIELN